MKATVLDEPLLEFAGGGRHIDPRHGITDYGPADVTEPTPRVVRAAIIGPQASIDGLQHWLDRCRTGIGAHDDTHLKHLYVPFPGFDIDHGFRSLVNFSPRLTRAIPKRDLDDLETMNPLKAVTAAVELYDRELAALHDEASCDVVIVCRPDNLNDTNLGIQTAGSGAGDNKHEPAAGDFHSLLKARSLLYKQPIQMVRRSTWDSTFKNPADPKAKANQDEATRAWNLHTALYYKNGGVPWRLPRDPTDLTSCYVGIAFYRSPDHQTLHTSVAQVFNQRGDGVIVRGGQATISKGDRQPHLTEQDAQELLESALQRYRTEHRTSPARVVLHKASNYTPEEIAGLRQAANNERLDVLELLWLTSADHVRLYRKAQQPPLRGTLLSLDDTRHILYTRGAVPFYKTYPGMYVPQPLGIRTIDTESSPETLAAEVLALTKMNWNQTQLDGRDPITLRTARTVGSILRHHDSDAVPSGRYAHYM